MPGMVPFLLSHVHERLGEPVPVFDIVAAATPYPVPVEVLRSPGPAAAAAGQFSFPAGPADGVDYSSCGDGVGESCFTAR